VSIPWERPEERRGLFHRRQRDIVVRQLLTKGRASPLAGALDAGVLQFFDIGAEGGGGDLFPIAEDQGGGQFGGIGDDLPAVEGMVAAQPLVLPLGGDLAAEGCGRIFPSVCSGFWLKIRYNPGLP